MSMNDNPEPTISSGNMDKDIDPDITEHQSSEFEALMKQGFEALMPTIRASNSLPKNQQWDLFCTAPAFKPIMESLGNKTLDLMATIMQNQGLHRDIRKRDLEEKYELVVEANDKILEKVGIHLDELSGIRKNPNQSVSEAVVNPVTVSGSWNRDLSNSSAWKEAKLRSNTKSPVVLRNARVTQRPQVKFLDKIDNSSTPFEPRITEKPNALKPLAILVEDLPGEETCYSHPYEFEIERFQEMIGSLDPGLKKPQPPKPLLDTPFLMVTEENQLMLMLQELKTHKEIAVDLEHHSYRSFQGFTCLLQLSTREKDYVVDTLLLRHKLHVLNEVFTDPKIVKVFHGADSDIQWLQRDLCLYVVNMFDTYQAALLLSLPRLSLAYLLKTLCDVDANKHFQLYDWRTRPLAEEALKYAREDTHYLLYVFDMLWNQLIKKSNGGSQLLQSVLFRSADTCKKRYWKSILKENSYEGIYRQSRKTFDNRQMYALKELYCWRDKTAREEDESIGYVLPNHMLLLIAEKLPKEMQGILACCNPIPPLVRQNLVHLHQIVLKAREQPLVVKVVANVNSETRLRPTPHVSVNLEGALHCPHDLTHNVDYRDDLPTLLSSSDTIFDTNSNIILLQNQPTVSIFEENTKSLTNSTKMNFPSQIHFMSPFDRYKKMVAYLENEEHKTNDEKEREILQDTQKLLNECSEEILRMQAAQSANVEMNANEMLNIKEEKDEQSLEPNLRKRNRSQCDQQDNDHLSGSVKEELTPAKCGNFPYTRDKRYEGFLASINADNSQKVKKENDLEVIDEISPSKSKKRKKSLSQGVMPMNVGTQKKTAANKMTGEVSHKKRKQPETFTQYDYSQVDYNQFQFSQPSSLTTSKKSQEGFKHKGKKKHQNKSFTFARQYGGATNKKS